MALLTAEDRAKIPVARSKPQLLRVACDDENGLDPIHLRTFMREQLRAWNYAQARGDAGVEMQVVYLDSMDDDLPGALLPKLRYKVAGNKITVRI